MRQRMTRIRALAASGALWGALACASLLGCVQTLPRDLTVAQQRAAIECLEAQGFRHPSMGPPGCRDAVWAVLAEAEANADCTEDADCFARLLPPADFAWFAASGHWLEVKSTTHSLDRVEKECGQHCIIPSPEPRVSCEAGRCRLHDYPRIRAPLGFTCPQAGL